jgi:hypothetical protein
MFCISVFKTWTAVEPEQRKNMNFCFKLGKTATETHEMLVRVYGDAAVSKKMVHTSYLSVLVVMLNQLKRNNVQVIR